MRRVKNATERGFDRHDRSRLARTLPHITDVRTYRRVQAVGLVAQGRAISEAAGVVGARPWSVYAWMQKYLRTHDPDGLADLPRGGRPRKVPAITDAWIVRELHRDPMRLGYSATGWTTALLARHLADRYGGPFSARTLRRRMHTLRLCWKRPRYVYATKDPNRAQKKGALSAA